MIQIILKFILYSLLLFTMSKSLKKQNLISQTKNSPIIKRRTSYPRDYFLLSQS